MACCHCCHGNYAVSGSWFLPTISWAMSTDINVNHNLNIKVVSALPSVLWCCWLGGRKGIRPVKKLAWWSVWSEMQTCIWPSWWHCHSLSLASVNSRLVLPYWYRLTQVVPGKGPLNGCVCVVHCLEKRQKCQNFKILAVKLYWSRIVAVICGVGVVGFLCFPFNTDLNLWNCELGTVEWVRTRLTPLIGQCVGDRIVSVSNSV